MTLDDETLASIASVRIYPSIGISRVGNSEEWFYGPEIPGRIDTPNGGFKDANGAIKRQVRLRIIQHCYPTPLLADHFAAF